MKALVLTNKGIEKTSSQEITELTKAKILEIKEGIVEIECTKEELTKLTYMGRTFNKTIQILDKQKIRNIQDIKIPDLTQLIKNKKIRVDCEREGEHEFNSFEVENKIGKQITQTYKTQIDFKNPDVIVFIKIEQEQCWIGIDYAGIDLGKRYYRIFLGKEALRGNIAAALLKLAEYKNKDKILDPFCRHGIIPIEAALMATKTSVNKYIKEKLAVTKLFKQNLEKYDKTEKLKGEIIASDPNFKHIYAAKKNAKIAGIIKNITFSRQELKWLDVKFKKEQIDKIITLLPPKNKQDCFFNQAEYILKEKGKLILCTIKETEELEKTAKTHNFKIRAKQKIMQGQQELTAYVFEK